MQEKAIILRATKLPVKSDRQHGSDNMPKATYTWISPLYNLHHCTNTQSSLTETLNFTSSVHLYESNISEFPTLHNCGAIGGFHDHCRSTTPGDADLDNVRAVKAGESCGDRVTPHHLQGDQLFLILHR